jgi:hypothetical protein
MENIKKINSRRSEKWDVYKIPFYPISNNRHLNFHLLMKEAFAAPTTVQPNQPTHSKIQDNENS